MLFLQIYKKGVLFFVETMNYSGYSSKNSFCLCYMIEQITFVLVQSYFWAKNVDLNKIVL